MEKLKIRHAAENDIPGISRLLYQVHKVHSDVRPDLFRPGGKKYTDDELKANGLLPEHTTASINNMNFPTFANTLMSIYQQRFGLGSFR